MKNAFIIITLIFCFGCQNGKLKKEENVNEEVTVILNTFEKGIVWVSKNDFKDMYALTKNLPHKEVKRIRKYSVTDSLFSMNKFKSLYYQKHGKYVKSTVAFQFKSFKSMKSDGFEIISADIDTIKLDLNYNGNLTFSRVIFNKEGNRAKYYFEQSIMFSKYRGWGMGTYIYAKKINDKWVFDRGDQVWIA
ncbi:hypothetical protein D3C87_546810 [compost metagenome]|uniref:hypothetical protein n=1 Tax=Pedobacter ghigonis TaxID=2730403 RepID=UPI000FAB8401|nr:hypothetical protein [Pedobacter ghigonis]